ncbi:hypothetical protein [Pseudomonas sp.]|jgi:hypothetical protein|uniref:hypothetical protein n=1 Tax=Pseudomonas sp. TaxID=306 RepID=UPI003FD755C7
MATEHLNAYVKSLNLVAPTPTDAQVERLRRYLLSKPDHYMTMRKLRDRVRKLSEFKDKPSMHLLLKACIQQIPHVATVDGDVITIHMHDLLIEV